MKQHDSSLDARFQQWAAARRAGDEHLRQLTARIVWEAGRRRRLGRVAAMAGSPLRGANLAYGLAAAAVLAVVAAGVGPLLRQNGRSAAPRNDAEWVRITDRDADAGRRLFGEIGQVFDQRLHWMAECSDGVRVGVGERADTAVPSGELVAVRLVVVARDGLGATWRPVWTASIILRSDERVQLAADRDGQNRLTLWAHAVDGGAVAMDVDLNLGDPVRIASTADAVVVDGHPMEVASLRMGSREYRVLQAARAL